MGSEFLQNFITLPELPDIISYLILLVVLICEQFLKKFVQKDNNITVLKVNEKTKNLETIISDYKKEKKALEIERNKICKEFNILKEAIKKSANNNHELVSNGTANEISKMLSEELQDSEVEEDE